MMFLRNGMYRRTNVLWYMLVVLSSLSHWFHCLTSVSWYQLWCIQVCLSSPVLLPNVFINFNDFGDKEQSLTKPEKLVEKVEYKHFRHKQIFLSNFPPCAFLITNILKFVIFHIVHCILVRRWIAVNEMSILYMHW
jgi:hypothetical protein